MAEETEDRTAEPQRAPADVPIEASPVVLPPEGGAPAWKQGRGCGSVWLWLLAMAAVAGAVLMVAGYATMRQSVWAGHTGAVERIRSNLPRDLRAGERVRLQESLQRWEAHIASLDDPYPEIGAFVALNREHFVDGRLTAAEAQSVSDFVAERIGPGPADGGAAR